VIRAVLDSNVLVAGIPNRIGIPSQIVDAWMSGRFQLVISDVILDEVAGAWQNRYWSARFTPERIHRAIQLLRTEGEVVIPTDTVSGIAAHPHDDLVLAAALSGSADLLVTGDRELLALREFRGVRIVTPREFLDILATRKLGA
jgi:putative PIN family toxin of toxin-antitoxin system